MAAVIRVKRRVDEEPLNAFVLNSKRRKCDQTAGIDATEFQNNKEEISTVLKFAGTVHNQTDSVVQVTKLSKDEAKETMTKVRKPAENRQRNRDEQRANSQQNRFKIVNCSRTLDAAENNGEAASQPITIVDIEKQNSPNSIPDSQTQSHLPSMDPMTIQPDQDGFVYDLYVPEVGQPEVEFHDNFLENMLSVEPYDDLIFGSYRDNGIKKYDEMEDCESEDSNDENNYRNDYPDTDEGSIGDEDMQKAVAKLCLNDDGNSDSDSDGENEYYLTGSDPQNKPDSYVHSIDPNDPTFEGDIDFQDVADRYGDAYAQYKRRVLKAFEKAKCEDIDEEDEEKSCSSSDFSGYSGKDDEECFSENELDKYA